LFQGFPALKANSFGNEINALAEIKIKGALKFNAPLILIRQGYRLSVAVSSVAVRSVASPCIGVGRTARIAVSRVGVRAARVGRCGRRSSVGRAAGCRSVGGCRGRRSVSVDCSGVRVTVGILGRAAAPENGNGEQGKKRKGSSHRIFSCTLWVRLL
jgi:hypothetical protein